jgi:hypothetical protein
MDSYLPQAINQSESEILNSRGKKLYNNKLNDYNDDYTYNDVKPGYFNNNKKQYNHTKWLIIIFRTSI